MNTPELKAAESALETALEQVRQLIASDLEPEPETKRITGVPLTVAPEEGSDYWYIDNDGSAGSDIWTNHAIDTELLARGNVFASERDAEFASKHKAIWAMPIGEWQEDGPCWLAGVSAGALRIFVKPSVGQGTFRYWFRGEVAFTDEGKVELERRIAATEALFKEHGL